jgi:cytidylate kinase
MRITLSGDLGSGKSSVGKVLAKRLGVEHFSAGSLFRSIGQISNLDALRTNLAAEDNVEIDHKVDDRTRQIDSTIDSFIIDSRMAWRLVSNATKVYLSVAPKTAAARVVSDGTRSSEAYDSLSSAMAALAERRQSETRRYKKLYGVDITDIDNYDLFIITDDANVEDIAGIILAFAEQKTGEKFWLPKTRVVPMIGIADAGGDHAARPVRLSDDFRLPLLIADNFGFYFEDPSILDSAFGFELPIIPYVSKQPASILAGEDAVKIAQHDLTLDDLTLWEDAFGVKLAFADQLRAVDPA